MVRCSLRWRPPGWASPGWASRSRWSLWKRACSRRGGGGAGAERQRMRHALAAWTMAGSPERERRDPGSRDRPCRQPARAARSRAVGPEAWPSPEVGSVHPWSDLLTPGLIQPALWLPCSDSLPWGLLARSLLIWPAPRPLSLRTMEGQLASPARGSHGGPKPGCQLSWSGRRSPRCLLGPRRSLRASSSDRGGGACVSSKRLKKLGSWGRPPWALGRGGQ